MTLLLKNLLFTIFVPGTVAVLVPLLIADGRTPTGGWALSIAVALFALGAGVYVCCVWDFASFGRGTPAPIDAPRRLVVRGLYRYTRNPMYVGVLTIIVAWAVFFQTTRIAVYAVLVAACFQTFICVYEEPHLAREFDGEYATYKSEVGRWLPRPPRTPDD